MDVFDADTRKVKWIKVDRGDEGNYSGWHYIPFTAELYYETGVACSRNSRLENQTLKARFICFTSSRYRMSCRYDNILFLDGFLSKMAFEQRVKKYYLKV